MSRPTHAELIYDARKGESTRRVNPLGLVSKRHTWYLLADTDDGHRTFRLDRVRSIEARGECFEIPEGFDLQAAWAAVPQRFDSYPGRMTTTVIANHSSIEVMRASGVEVVVDSEQDDGRVNATASAWTVTMLAEKVAGMITHIELVDPPFALTRQLHQIGTELLRQFGPGVKG